ncbi:MAG TPA: hypothetical protein DCS09_02265 [Porphyromonadaceae bacterium]|nr:hypothetical protein [Porphyromonadaceae bacterium]
MLRCLLVLVLALWAMPSLAATIPATLAECNALCDQYFQGGDVTPPVIPPTATAKPYPGRVTFDKTSDQGSGAYAGTACLLIDPGMVKVVLNGEVALKGNMYGGRDVWRFLKVGDGYIKPWNFTFTHADGTVYTYIVSGNTNPAEPTGPTGGRTESANQTSCGNPTGSNCRPNFRFDHPGEYYGKNIQIFIDGKLISPIVADGSKRKEYPDGTIWKPRSDSNGNLVVVGPYGGKGKKTCVIKW